MLPTEAVGVDRRVPASLACLCYAIAESVRRASAQIHAASCFNRSATSAARLKTPEHFDHALRADTARDVNSPNGIVRARRRREGRSPARSPAQVAIPKSPSLFTTRTPLENEGVEAYSKQLLSV